MFWCIGVQYRCTIRPAGSSKYCRTRKNVYILLDVLVYNIAVYFYEICSIQRTSKNIQRYCTPKHLIYKFANFARLYFPQFATKLSNFTNFKMLFQAVVKDFVRLAWIKIYSSHQISSFSNFHKR